MKIQAAKSKLFATGGKNTRRTHSMISVSETPTAGNSPASSSSERTYHKVNEPFKPHYKDCGLFVCEIVDRQKGLRDGPKRLYQKLVRHADRKSCCFPSFHYLAKELGKS